ncbi:hypothetical protein JCM5350_002753 [Sporobolomyces pararoseus]
MAHSNKTGQQAPDPLSTGRKRSLEDEYTNDLDEASSESTQTTSSSENEQQPDSKKHKFTEELGEEEEHTDEEEEDKEVEETKEAKQARLQNMLQPFVTHNGNEVEINIPAKHIKFNLDAALKKKGLAGMVPLLEVVYAMQAYSIESMKVMAEFEAQN